MNRVLYIVCLVWLLAAKASLPPQHPLPPVNELRGYACGLDALGQRRSAARNFGLTNTTVAIGYDPLAQLTSWRAVVETV